MTAGTSRWLDEFLDWLRASDYAENSIKCYRWRLRGIDAWLKARGWEPTRLLDPEVLRLYLSELDEARPTPLGVPVRRSIESSVSCWLRYAYRMGLLPTEPPPRRRARAFAGRGIPWLDAFIDWLRAHGYSKHTMDGYRVRLYAIDRWLQRQGWEPTRLADPEVLADYERELENAAPIGKPSLRRLGDAVTCWLAYARSIGLVPAQPPSARESRPVKTQPWLEPFEAHLRRAGFRRGVIMGQLHFLERVGEFLMARGLEPTQLADEDTRSLYLGEWEASFIGQRRPNANSRAKIVAAIRRWLIFAGLVEAAPPRCLPAAMEDFLSFIREHRGLSASSLREHRKNLSALSDFLTDQGHSDPVGIPLALLDDFVAQGRKSRNEVARVAAAVRGFLRYLFMVGLEAADRSGWVDTPRIYRNERLPRHLTDTQLEQALAQVDRQTDHGKKVWAVLMLLINYGLRIGEVANLRLDDLGWDGGWVRVTRGKTREVSTYPMTPAVEEALRDYLMVRPNASNPQLFLTTKAPYRAYAGAPEQLVRTVLIPVVGRRGQGAHALRHTLARRLRQAGISLPLMRQILGHRTSNSTGRYLRIALDELREVADNYADLL